MSILIAIPLIAFTVALAGLGIWGEHFEGRSWRDALAHMFPTESDDDKPKSEWKGEWTKEDVEREHQNEGKEGRPGWLSRLFSWRP